MRFSLFLIIILFISSCYKDNLYVQQEWVDKDFLASSHVGTPDPKQKNPPQGRRLIIGWDFPRSIYKKSLSLHLTVRFWDNTQDLVVFDVHRKRGYRAFYFEDKTQDRSKGILTYRIEVVTKDGEVINTWKHHFWTKLIDVDKDENSQDDLNSIKKSDVFD